MYEDENPLGFDEHIFLSTRERQIQDANRLFSLAHSYSSVGEIIRAAVVLKEGGFYGKAKTLLDAAILREPANGSALFERIALCRVLREYGELDELLLAAIAYNIVDDRILVEIVARCYFDECSPRPNVAVYFKASSLDKIKAGKNDGLACVAGYMECNHTSIRECIDGVARRSQSSEQVFRHLEMKISNGEPFLLLRMGDGEGAVLAEKIFGFSEEERSKWAFGRYFADRWWGDPTVLSDVNFRHEVEELIGGLEQVDVLGVPQAKWFRHEASGRNLERALSVAAIMKLPEMPNFTGVIGSTTVSIDMMYSGQLRKLVQSFDKIVCITSHPNMVQGLSSLVRADAEISTIPIPPHSDDRKMTGYEISGSHWRDRFPEIMAELDHVAPGTLVLVAAGFLGKIYAVKARRRGASVVDIGAAADYLAGYDTRPILKQIRADPRRQI